jgi:hypothetical protein
LKTGTTIETAARRRRSIVATPRRDHSHVTHPPTDGAPLMGLAERRKIQELKEQTLPARSREIAEICGAEVPYDVDWASFENDAQALNFLDNLSCHRLNMALRTICVDALGREAVQGGLARVRLRNVADPAQRHIAIADGVLEMHCAYAQGTAGMHSDGAIRDLLMAAL